ncbi:MAG: RluA family pseudouridine synthase [Firmicutes bacterium]|nr:RluA family pseudouridine synthase [Bacillota bacterium]
MKIVVSEEGIRLDKYLASNTDYSRELISKMITAGFVLVNEETKKNSYKVKINDEIDIDESYKIDTDIVPCKMDIHVVYEDDDVMVINKPSGLVVHPGSGNYTNTLVNGLMAYTNDLSNVNGEARVGIVHRIDKDTSGLMIVAKNNAAHLVLAEGFKNHDIKRTYVALLCGELPYDKATIDAPIKRDDKNFNKMGVFKDGKKAITHLKVLKRYQGYTLVELNLETGRTHQIRVHMNYIGFPIHNDPVYNAKEATEFGQFLHSKSIDFEHPITKVKLHFESELPKEFSEFLDRLN